MTSRRNNGKPKKIAVIVNPSSAGGKSLAVWPRYQQSLESQGYAVTQHTTTSESDFRETTKTFARKFTTLAVCGGDSSLTIAAEELLAQRFRGELLFLPGGSVNDIVLDIRSQQAHVPRSIYLGEVTCVDDTKQFIGQANWGLGVVVNRWVAKTLGTLPLLRPLQNLVGFAAIVAAHLLQREIVEGEIVTGKTSVRGRWSIVIVSQIQYWASGLRFCPQASYHSPEFEILSVDRCGLIRLIRIILAAKTGRHVNFPEVTHRLVRSVEIRYDKPQAVQVDGDILHGANGPVFSMHYQLRKRKTQFGLATPA